MKTTNFQEIDQDIQKQLEAAREASKKVFPRDRDVAIGAVVVADDGRVFEGANSVKERFITSTCAERMALDKALFEGINKIKRIVIIGENKDYPFTEVASPCGNCRQMIWDTLDDLGQEDVELVLANSGMSKVVITTVKELLPLAYKSSRNNA